MHWPGTGAQFYFAECHCTSTRSGGLRTLIIGSQHSMTVGEPSGLPKPALSMCFIPGVLLD